MPVSVPARGCAQQAVSRRQALPVGADLYSPSDLLPFAAAPIGPIRICRFLESVIASLDLDFSDGTSDWRRALSGSQATVPQRQAIDADACAPGDESTLAEIDWFPSSAWEPGARALLPWSGYSAGGGWRNGSPSRAWERGDEVRGAGRRCRVSPGDPMGLCFLAGRSVRRLSSIVGGLGRGD